MWARIHLIPLLQAEEDRDLVRKMLADQAREKELLGSVSSPYNSDRYVRNFAVDCWESGTRRAGRTVLTASNRIVRPSLAATPSYVSK